MAQVPALFYQTRDGKTPGMFPEARASKVLWIRATHGALRPHRAAPSTRCTAESVHRVWHRHLTPSLAALAAQVLVDCLELSCLHHKVLSAAHSAHLASRWEQRWFGQELGAWRRWALIWALRLFRWGVFLLICEQQGRTWCTATPCTFH